MSNQDQQSNLNFITPELTHRVELILHLLEYSNHLVIVKGEHESGKTTLYEELTRQEETNLIIRKLSANAHMSSNDIFKAIIDSGSDNELQEATYNQAALNQWLERCQNKQQIPVLLIDNVNLFSDELINNLFEILLNSNSVAVLHLCLFCDPSFLNQLEEPGINHDDARSLHIIEIPGLSEKQTELYIHYKYPEGDATHLNLFDDKRIKQIHRISHGMPGRINALCEQYLDDPAKKAVVSEEKPSFTIKVFLIKNKLILITGMSLLFLFIGATTLLHKTDKEKTETIKLDLPNINKDKADQAEFVKVMPLLVPEPTSETDPMTIEDLSPPVIPEMNDDLKNDGELTFYDTGGQPVAKESDLTIVNSVRHSVEVVADSETVAQVEKAVETITKPETEPLEQEVGKPATSEIHDVDWLIKQDADKYVLQLIGAYEKETINLYLKSFKYGDDKIIRFNTSNKGKEWHVLAYGLYDDRDAAVAAIEKLPTKAKLMAPWPRTVGSIKDLLK